MKTAYVAAYVLTFVVFYSVAEAVRLRWKVLATRPDEFRPATWDGFLALSIVALPVSLAALAGYFVYRSIPQSYELLPAVLTWVAAVLVPWGIVLRSAIRGVMHYISSERRHRAARS